MPSVQNVAINGIRSGSIVISYAVTYDEDTIAASNPGSSMGSVINNMVQAYLIPAAQQSGITINTDPASTFTSGKLHEKRCD